MKSGEAGEMKDKQDKERHLGRPREFDPEAALNAALALFWKRGYEPASVADLCQAMGIKAPSLYATFGNKAALFLEALRYYENKYWREPTARFMAEPDIFKAVEDYFNEACAILLAPDTPCGCMLTLAAVNISEEETEIIEAVRQMRMETKRMFAERLRKAIADRQIPADTDVPSLAGLLNTVLEGLSLQARDNIFQSELKAMAAYAVRMLPPRLDNHQAAT